MLKEGKLKAKYSEDDKGEVKDKISQLIIFYNLFIRAMRRKWKGNHLKYIFECKVASLEVAIYVAIIINLSGCLCELVLFGQELMSYKKVGVNVVLSNFLLSYLMLIFFKSDIILYFI